MAEVKWVKLTTDMFDNRKVKHLRKLPEGNNIVLIWVMLLTMAGRCNSGGMIFLTENIPYTPKMLADELDFEEWIVIKALYHLEEVGFIDRSGKHIKVIKPWEDKHDRNSDRYKKWRKCVYERDGYRCQVCGTNKELQAHHKKAWKISKELRYDVDNGITLCRKCHLEAHGGCWRNG